MHVDRSKPAQHTHRDSIGTGQVVFHLFDQVIVGVKTQVVIEAFLIVSVAAFHLAVVPRRPWTDQVMPDPQLLTQQIEDMRPFRWPEVREFTAVIRLDFLRLITEKADGAFYKVHCRITALFLVSPDEPDPAGFLQHRVLVEPFSVLSCVASHWHVLYVHLPLFSQFHWRFILPLVFGQFLGRYCFLPVSQSDEYPIQRSRMSAVMFPLPQFPVHFAHADIGVSAMEVCDPFQFFRRMGIGMRAVRSMGSIQQ